MPKFGSLIPVEVGSLIPVDRPGKLSANSEEFQAQIKE